VMFVETTNGIMYRLVVTGCEFAQFFCPASVFSRSGSKIGPRHLLSGLS
jgi:hypothetical protein